MCNHFLTVVKGGGQNRKAKKNRVRRTDVTSTPEHLDTTASPSLFYPHNHPEYAATAVSSDLSCPICAAVLQRPLQLACGRQSNGAKYGVLISFPQLSEWKKHGQDCSVRFKKQHR